MKLTYTCYDLHSGKTEQVKKELEALDLVVAQRDIFNNFHGTELSVDVRRGTKKEKQVLAIIDPLHKI